MNSDEDAVKPALLNPKSDTGVATVIVICMIMVVIVIAISKEAATKRRGSIEKIT